jgi:hypothetical protein
MCRSGSNHPRSRGGDLSFGIQWVVGVVGRARIVIGWSSAMGRAALACDGTLLA